MDAATLSKAMGCSLARAKQMVDGYNIAMKAANITNVNRAAMFAAQIGTESLGLRYMEEIASGAAYEGRDDLGNTQRGDGRRFKGSGPIQLTGRYNFTKFSKWAAQQGHIKDPRLFVDRPELVRSNPTYGFLAASWYWTVAAPSLNRLSDAKDVRGATKAINGGYNGLADRQARFTRCLKLGKALLPGDVEPEYFEPKGVSMSVKAIQKAVGVTADGYYGDDTKKAVKALQKTLGVTADGLWGPKTEKAYKASDGKAGDVSSRAALKYMGNVSASTRTIAEEVVDHLDSIGKPLPTYPDMKSPVIWGKDSNPKNTEHYSGRALDFMIRNSPSVGDAVADYVWANRVRFGLTHIIWRQRIKSTVTQPGVWRPMSDRGSPTENHMDHPHCYFNGKSVTGSPKKPSKSSGSSKSTYFEPKGVSMTVKQIQKAAGVTADGYYGDDTKAAVKVLQRRLGVTADGLWGPATEKAYKGSSGSSSSKPEASSSKPKAASKAPKFPLPKGSYFGPKSGPKASVSGYYSHKADLKKWQAQMRKRGWSITADGLYGSNTRTVVRAFQKEKGLTVDGKIGPKTWAAAWTEKVT